MGAQHAPVTSINGAAAANVRRVWAQRVLVIGLWLAIFLLWRGYQSSNDLSTAEAGQRFINAIDAARWVIFAYIGVYLVRPLVLFPASVLTAMGGVLFGPWLGVAVVIVAANMSALVAYGVGRLLGNDPDAAAFDARGDDRSFVSRWSGRLREHSFETVFVMRLLFLPYDLVNYVCGVLRVTWTSFLLATALGSLPGTVSFVLLGASLERVDQGINGINPWAVYAGVAIFIISLVISYLLRKRQP
ncbi:MAG: TVP38/TMEM64 family protein [Ilumatobacter sp.]|nr:TVP38/TMEM64 family protein [Ilumatobacter sp.]